MHREINLESLRSAYRSEQIAPFRLLLTPRVIATLDTMLMDPAFPGATDPSALSLLAMIIKVNQPDRVLEIGTYIGFSTIVMAGCLSANRNGGRIYTVETDAEKQDKAGSYADQAGLSNTIHFLNASSTDPQLVELLRQHGPYDLIYIDSFHSYEHTLQELALYVEDDAFTGPSTVVAFHDAGGFAATFDPTGEGGVPRALGEWYSRQAIRQNFQRFIFEPPVYPNPCGLAIICRICTKVAE